MAGDWFGETTWVNTSPDIISGSWHSWLLQPLPPEDKHPSHQIGGNQPRMWLKKTNRIGFQGIREALKLLTDILFRQCPLKFLKNSATFKYDFRGDSAHGSQESYIE